jgi:hypothetical protein
LIEDQDQIFQACVYYYAGPLKDAIYALLIQHLTGTTDKSVERNEFNEIDFDFIQSEKASRLASYLYEAKTEANVEIVRPPTPDHRADDDADSLSSVFSFNENDSD